MRGDGTPCDADTIADYYNNKPDVEDEWLECMREHGHLGVSTYGPNALPWARCADRTTIYDVDGSNPREVTLLRAW